MHLGSLWAARDYARTGDYLHQALALARETGDISTLAHSLNRAGNWYMHTEWPLEGQHYHQEALALFLSVNSKYEHYIARIAAPIRAMPAMICSAG